MHPFPRINNILPIHFHFLPSLTIQISFLTHFSSLPILLLLTSVISLSFDLLKRFHPPFLYIRITFTPSLSPFLPYSYLPLLFTFFFSQAPLSLISQFHSYNFCFLSHSLLSSIDYIIFPSLPVAPLPLSFSILCTSPYLPPFLPFSTFFPSFATHPCCYNSSPYPRLSVTSLYTHSQPLDQTGNRGAIKGDQVAHISFRIHTQRFVEIILFEGGCGGSS